MSTGGRWLPERAANPSNFVLPAIASRAADKEIASNPRAGWSFLLPATGPRAARAHRLLPDPPSEQGSGQISHR